jgi:hypothetical protein
MLEMTSLGCSVWRDITRLVGAALLAAALAPTGAAGSPVPRFERGEMLSRLQISRVPLLLRELRSGDRSRAAAKWPVTELDRRS